VHPLDVPFTQAVKAISRWGSGSKDLVGRNGKKARACKKKVHTDSLRNCHTHSCQPKEPRPACRNRVTGSRN
jgi:hypothetical protein